MVQQIPLVDYLVLESPPHLLANKCVNCGARYFDRRNACAKCSGTEFQKVKVADHGTLRAFTIVSKAAEGIKVPFVAAVVDCGDLQVRGNLVNIAPRPECIKLGMELRLATVPAGVDSAGTQAIGFGFEPVSKHAGPCGEGA